MTAHVPAADAQVRKVAAETAMADRWRRLCDPTNTGVTLTELADNHLGMPRSKLCESFEPGARHPRAAWLELLPAQAEIAYLRERALHHGFDLAATTVEHAVLVDVVGEAGRVLAAIATTEADGHISPAEAITDIAAIERLEQQLAKAKAARRSALEHRGLSLAVGGKR